MLIQNEQKRKRNASHCWVGKEKKEKYSWELGKESKRWEKGKHSIRNWKRKNFHLIRFYFWTSLARFSIKFSVTKQTSLFSLFVSLPNSLNVSHLKKITCKLHWILQKCEHQWIVCIVYDNFPPNFPIVATSFFSSTS